MHSLIAFIECIRSERQLMGAVNLNLAHRWYIGYDLGEVVPDHSSLSKIRERYGLEVFHRFFEHIIELCIQARLVWDEELYFDRTKVQTNADIDATLNWCRSTTASGLQEHISLLTSLQIQVGW